MLQLSKIFWDICRLKAGPQALPTGHNLLISAVLAGIIIDSFASSIFMTKLSTLDVIITVVTYNFVLLMAVYFILYLVGYAGRAIQTLTAVAGAGFFISLVLLPALLVLNSSNAEVKPFGLLILIDNIWRISVNAHIFRHALSISLLMAMILSVSYLLFGILIAEYVLPTQAS